MILCLEFSHNALLADSTAASGYKVLLDRLKIHSVQIEGDNLVVDVDADLSVK